MSSTQVTESSKVLCVTFRLIKLKILKSQVSNSSFKLDIKLGSQKFSTLSSKPCKNSIKLNQITSFDLNEENVATLTLVQENFLFLNQNIASCSFKIFNKSSPCTKLFHLYCGKEAVAVAVVSFLVDEKNEPFWKYQMMHKVELEKEEIRIKKGKYLRKLRELKIEKVEFRENMSSCLNELKENIDFKRSKNGSVNKSDVVLCKNSLEKLRISSLGLKNNRSYLSKGII